MISSLLVVFFEVIILFVFDDKPSGVCCCSDQPCKTDLDVFRAVENTELSRLEYPLVYHWRNNVLSYDEDVRNRSV